MHVFLAAAALGLILNAAPGPVFAETVRRGARGGFRPALAVQLGSLAGDAAWAVLGLLGVGLLFRLDAIRIPVGLAGVAYLVHLSWDSWRASNRQLQIDPVPAEARARPGDEVSKALRAGALLSVTNVQNVAYWAALGSALGAVGVTDPTPADFASYFAGFMTASVVWSFVCAACVERLFRGTGARVTRLTYRACAIAFLALALSAARDLWMGCDFVRRPSDREQFESR